MNNFRFNESPVDLLGRATEAGRTEKTLPREWSDWFTRAAMPALRVPGLQHEHGQPGELIRGVWQAFSPVRHNCTTRSGEACRFAKVSGNPWEQLTATDCTVVITLCTGTTK